MIKSKGDMFRQLASLGEAYYNDYQAQERMRAENDMQRAAFENAKAMKNPEVAAMDWKTFKDSEYFTDFDTGGLNSREVEDMRHQFELNSEKIHYEANVQYWDTKNTRDLTQDFMDGVDTLKEATGQMLEYNDPELDRKFQLAREAGTEMNLPPDATTDMFLDMGEAGLKTGDTLITEYLIQESKRDWFTTEEQLVRLEELKRMYKVTQSSKLSRQFDIDMDNAIKEGRPDKAAALTKQAGIYEFKQGNDYVQKAVGRYYKNGAEQVYRARAVTARSLDALDGILKTNKVSDSVWGVGGEYDTAANQTRYEQLQMQVFNQAFEEGWGAELLNRSEQAPAILTRRMNNTLSTIDSKGDGKFFSSDVADDFYQIAKELNYDGAAIVAKMGADGRSARIYRRFTEELALNPSIGPAASLEEAVKKVESADKMGSKQYPEAYQALSSNNPEFLYLDEPRAFRAMMSYRQYVLDHTPEVASQMAMEDADARSLELGDRMVWNGYKAKTAIDAQIEEKGLSRVNTVDVMGEVYDHAVEKFNTKLLQDKGYDLDNLSVDDIEVQWIGDEFLIRAPAAAKAYFHMSLDEVMGLGEKLNTNRNTFKAAYDRVQQEHRDMVANPRE